MSKTTNPMPIKWQMLIDVLPKHNWKIIESAISPEVGYSPKYANTTLPGILKRDIRFCKALKAKRDEIAAKTGINEEEVVFELKKVGMSNIQDFVENNEIRDISELPRDIVAAVESIQVDIRHDPGKSEGYTERVKLKLHNKLNALEQLGRYLGVFERDNSQRRQVFNLILGRPERKVVNSTQK